MDDLHSFRLLVEHEHDSEDPYDFHEWVDLGPIRDSSGYLNRLYGDEPYEVSRDAIGRRLRDGAYGWYHWRLLVCNNSSCPGRARYRSDLVAQAASEWEGRRVTGG